MVAALGDARTAVTIGAYDGVHLGHRAVIAQVRERATALGARSVVVTFDRHPASVVRPESAPKLLTDPQQKLELLASTGVDATLVVPRLEAPRVHHLPEVFGLVPWGETEDPVAITASLVGRSAGVIAIGDTMWARFLVELMNHLPSASYRRAVDVLGDEGAGLQPQQAHGLERTAERRDHRAEIRAAPEQRGVGVAAAVERDPGRLETETLHVGFRTDREHHVASASLATIVALHDHVVTVAFN